MEYRGTRSTTPPSGDVVDIDILALPCSQFWISYLCDAVVLSRLASEVQADVDGRDREGLGERECESKAGVENEDGEEGWPLPNDEVSNVKHVLFKLHLPTSPACEAAVSWGTGAGEQWCGKMVFGLFDAGTDFEGGRVVEKRGLFFKSFHDADDGDDEETRQGVEREKGFEVRVYRANGRRRVGVEVRAVSWWWRRGRVRLFSYGGDRTDHGSGLTGLMCRMTPIGRKHRGERQRMYEYALLDPKEEPFVTFRYRFCTEGEWDGRDKVGSRKSLTYVAEGLRNESPAPSSISQLDETDDLISLPQEEVTESPQSLPPAPNPSPMSTPSNTPLISHKHSLPPRLDKASPPPSPIPSPTPFSLPEPLISHPPSTPIKRYPSHHKRTGSPQITLSPTDSAEDIVLHRGDVVRTPSPIKSEEFEKREDSRMREGFGTREQFAVEPGTPPSHRKAATGRLLRAVVERAVMRSLRGRR